VSPARAVIRAGLLALVLVPALTFAADSGSWTDKGLRGGFRRQGQEFSCQVTITARSTPEDLLNGSDQPCLFFGSFEAAIAIGSFAKPLLTTLGPAVAIQPDTGGSRSHFFRFGDSDNPPFFVVSVVEERVAALQVSGPPDTTGLDNLSFAGIHLGSPADQVRKRFGAPLRTDKGSTAESEMWSYLPWTFSFEITSGKVTSIRIAHPALR